MADVVEPDDLDDDQHQELTEHLQDALDVVGLPHNHVDHLIDAIDTAIYHHQKD
ncbi:hypothetical protein [Ornithinimicrobium sufpigmenti]|uniref:hypothetical protein n=1 Tax=Ornithinimicrobium sufpigmenti TaxID=2508882 RepID=UPI0015E17C1F|nr:MULTISPECIES: hypothetical protein [unclassified Ornithinimicrobium]